MRGGGEGLGVPGVTTGQRWKGPVPRIHILVATRNVLGSARRLWARAVALPRRARGRCRGVGEAGVVAEQAGVAGDGAVRGGSVRVRDSASAVAGVAVIRARLPASVGMRKRGATIRNPWRRKWKQLRRTRAAQCKESNIRGIDKDGSLGGGSLAQSVSNDVRDGHGRAGRVDRDGSASGVHGAIVQDRDIALGVAAVRVGRGRDLHRRARGGGVDLQRPSRGLDGGRAGDIDTGGFVRADPVDVCLGNVRV